MSMTGSDGEMEAQQDKEHLMTFMKRLDQLQNAPSLPTRLPISPNVTLVKHTVLETPFISSLSLWELNDCKSTAAWESIHHLSALEFLVVLFAFPHFAQINIFDLVNSKHAVQSMLISIGGARRGEALRGRP